MPLVHFWFNLHVVYRTTHYILHYYYIYLYYILHITLNFIFANSPHSGKEENVLMEEHTFEQMDDHCDEQLDNYGTLPRASDATLGEFFSRPIVIHQAQWTPTADINTQIYPWELFFTNPRVENRLTNFKLIKANLMVKVVINGNSFYQGRLMVNYNPLAYFDEYLATGNFFYNHVRLYQRQKILCDPSQSIGGEMQLPFMWKNDFVDVVDMATEFQEMGSLTLRTLSPLRLATDSGSTAPVRITVFAWATNVEVGGLTDQDLNGMSPQAGDEYSSGPVSKVLKSVAKIASPLTAIPTIGPYARATEIAANAAASVAKLFGFSRPCNLEEPMRMQPRPTTALAVVEGPDNAMKMTLDPKQEVSIDPRLWNCDGMDCMSINRVASVDSLYAKFAWSGASPTGTRLFNTLVDPCVNQSADNAVHLPAIAGVTLPFDYWSGGLEYTFDIVCSSFHRGRLAVVYDPHDCPNSYVANTTYQQVIDISADRKFTIKVGNSQTQGLRKHYLPGSAVFASDQYFPGAVGGHSTTTAITSAMIQSAGQIGNGVISVWVLNELTSPSADVANIEILVSVKASPDYRVYVPNSALKNYSYRLSTEQLMEPHSGIEPVPIGVDTPVPVHTVDVRGSQLEAPNIYVGEQVLSIRSLVKRYCPYMSNQVTPSGYTAGNMIYLRHAIYPLMYLYSNQAVHRTTLSLFDNINYVNHTYISYFRPAYAILRGSTRWKYVPITSSPVGNTNSKISVYRSTGTYAPPTQVVMTSGTYSYPRSGVIAFQDNMAGEALTVTNTNGTLEFEAPFYSNQRFVYGSSGDDTKTPDVTSGFTIMGDSTSMGSDYLLYNAAGEDFTFGMFYGFPAMIVHATIPASA